MPLLAFTVALVSVTAGLAGGLILSDAAFGSLLPIASLALLALLAERQSVRLSSKTEISVSSLPYIFAAVVFSPLAAMAVGAFGLLGQFGRPHIRWVIWTASRALAGGLAGLAALAAGGPSAHSFAVLMLAAAAASMTDTLADLSLNALTLITRGSGSPRELARTTVPIFLSALPLYTPVIAVLAYAYREISPWSVALFLMPAYAAQRLFILYREQRATAEELTNANERLEKANLSFATALVTTLDARDRYTAGHSAAVAIYSRDIAARLELPEDQQNLAHLCGLVHDIGKIGLPAGLLEKPGPLTLAERRQMEQHSEIGERILAKVEDYAEVATIVRHHHERMDGQGYPDGLVGDEIPFIARIIAVADAYNAMTSDRPYRDAMPSRVARLRLAQAVETQFDTAAVAAFEAILAGASETYRMGSRGDFSLDAQERYSEQVSAVGAA